MIFIEVMLQERSEKLTQDLGLHTVDSFRYMCWCRIHMEVQNQDKIVPMYLGWCHRRCFDRTLTRRRNSLSGKIYFSLSACCWKAYHWDAFLKVHFRQPHGLFFRIRCGHFLSMQNFKFTLSTSTEKFQDGSRFRHTYHRCWNDELQPHDAAQSRPNLRLHVLHSVFFSETSLP